MTSLTRAVMIQATGSNAGKSTIVAGLARALVRRGLRVSPFKPQNMSNNAAVAVDGGEIGRAQAVQAMAARIPPSVHMNPVLLKPESDTGSQIIVQGKQAGHLRAADFRKERASLLPAVLDSFARLTTQSDIVLVEGAGSPAETNLRDGDIANMGFALAAHVPVVLVGDIDRGGVIASLAGTHVVLPDSDRALIRGFLINKFRGAPKLFDEGLRTIEALTGWPSLGVVPWLPAAALLPAEDALDLDRSKAGAEKKLTIAVPVLSRIANFDDLDPLGMEPNVELVFVRPGEVIPACAQAVILPGTKSTIGDMHFMRSQGWDIDIKAHVRRGGQVLGICGGYQLLGRHISDPTGSDGTASLTTGLGLLDVDTEMAAVKTTRSVSGRHLSSGTDISGYEIHLGSTRGGDTSRPMLTIDGQMDGARSFDGRVQGTYVHGLFVNDAFRKAWLAGMGTASDLAYTNKVEQALDALADHMEQHVNIDRLLEIAAKR